MATPKDTNQAPGALREDAKETTDIPYSGCASINSRLKVYQAIAARLKNRGSFSFTDVLIDSKTILNCTDFHNLLISMNMCVRKTMANRLIIVEKPESAFERFLYLKNVITLRKMKKVFYYIDINILDASLNTKKPWTEQLSNNSFTEKYVFYYVASRHGYVNGLFSNVYDQDDFEKWFMNIVLPDLIPSSVIVMDRIPFTCQSPLTVHSAKEDMIKLLNKYDIPHKASMHKSELFNLIQKCIRLKNENSFESLIKAYGFSVVIPPKTLYDLNISSQVWNHARKYIKLEPNATWLDNKNMILQLFSNDTPVENKHQWAQYEDNVEDIEMKLFDAEKDTDSSLAKVIFMNT